MKPDKIIIDEIAEKKPERKNGQKGMDIILPPHGRVAKVVTELTDDLKAEIYGMSSLMLKQQFHGGIQKGLSIAHPQVSFDPYRIFVMLEPGTKGILRVVINPEISELAGYFNPKEACLSFPNRKKQVPVGVRYRRLHAKWLNEKMEPQEKDVDGLVAQIFQHEIEHFDGKNIYGAY